MSHAHGALYPQTIKLATDQRPLNGEQVEGRHRQVERVDEVGRDGIVRRGYGGRLVGMKMDEVQHRARLTTWLRDHRGPSCARRRG